MNFFAGFFPHSCGERDPEGSSGKSLPRSSKLSVNLLWPLSRYTLSRNTLSQQPPVLLEMSRGVALHPPPLPPPKKDLVAPILCGEMSLQKRIALHGGVAAILTPIALHCATKPPKPRQKIPDTFLRVAPLQNETAPQSLNSKTKLETKSETKSSKTAPKSPRKMVSPVQLPKSFSPALFHSFASAISNAISSAISHSLLSPKTLHT